ncbi:MAG: translational GTPase TypA [Chloroflexi bacterium]|nr:translational GTPase TypA [Chloroflexota bacterium]
MTITYRNDIRNIAIIAHVDHGKTTLVDAMLRQSHIFRDNQPMGDFIMDSNPLEREKGITILAKNTAITYRGIKLNIIDTPGHGDFSGEVERVINMADGCLLLVDASEGPMPQTKFVLRQAFLKKLKPIVVINKIDRTNARPTEVLAEVQDLFLDLASEVEQLEFPVLYAVAKKGIAQATLEESGQDLTPLFEAIVHHIPPPKIDDQAEFQMQVSNLDYDSHKGRIAIGRIFSGAIAPHDMVATIDRQGNIRSQQINEVLTHMGLQRKPVERAEAGDIVAVTGLEYIKIGDTIAGPQNPQALPPIEIGEPTIKMTFGVNTSPFGGKEGRYSTSRQLRERLYRELETNISLRVEDTDSADVFLVSGRGELHLAILVENLRREGYEFQLSKPEVITRTVNGVRCEPYEQLFIDIEEQYIGIVTEMLSKRKAKSVNFRNDGRGNVRLEYTIPTRGLIGFRSAFLTATRGYGVMNSLFKSFEPWSGDIASTRSGVLVASETGVATTYGLNHAQERGTLFIEPNTPVYEGMIVGLNPRPADMAVNICKEKKQTNVRASTAEIAIKLSPAYKMSLEECLDFINDDELVEVTPTNIRLRKKILSEDARADARYGRTSRVAVR